ncbi:MAG: HD domain-containing protein [Syntrophobacterales bacterium]|nr:HD domain-containing protein [Syntrophobacterales bacterium]
MEDYPRSHQSYIDKAYQSIQAIYERCSKGGDLVKKAFEFALELHKDQRRRSGEPYIVHPVAVANIIASEFGVYDSAILAASLLHDTVEDIPSMSIISLKEQFSEDIASLVDGCTKIMLDPSKEKRQVQARTHSKIFLSASNNLGVIIIKLADRLHNMRTLHSLPSDKRMRISKETIDIYVPIAAKLNINWLKRELYHQALLWLYPKKSKRILAHIQSVQQNKDIIEIKTRLEEYIAKHSDVSVTIRNRCKGLGSYYNPFKKTLEISNAENFVDFTIVVHSEDPIHCYKIFGMVNKLFPPLPRTIRDFIANPKSNGYRSLHVRFHYGNSNYLVKIRTPAMDEWAFYGVLTHWRNYYDFDISPYEEEIMKFLRDIGEYDEAPPKRRELLHSHSRSEEIIVYTPTGDPHYLPKGSIVLDFAYKIHSDLGDRCKGAIISSTYVPPTHVLEEGDTVEIVKTTEMLDVHPEYESLCKTPLAKKHIIRLIQKRRREYAEKIGREILEQDLQNHGISLEILSNQYSETLRYILEFMNIRSFEELQVRIGQDLTSPSVIREYLGIPKKMESDILQLAPQNPPYIVSIGQIDNAVHKFAHCCRPYPGEDKAIVVLSERGVTIHKSHCKELTERHNIPIERRFRVNWLLDEGWDNPIMFSLIFPECNIPSLLSKWPHRETHSDIRKIEESLGHDGTPWTRILVVFKNLREAKNFIEPLIVFSDQMEIEYYRRIERS